MELISDEYRTVNTLSHRDNPGWGKGGVLWQSHIAGLLGQEGAHRVLDYGCGKGGMVRALCKAGFDAHGYDPCVPEFHALPEPADYLICLDVLEHVEPEHIDNVLRHIAGLAPKCFLVISCRKAKHQLADGRNAHLIIETPGSWIERLGNVFRTIRMERGLRDDELAVVCAR